MSSGATCGGGGPILLAPSAIRASWSFAALSLFASLAMPLKLPSRHAVAIVFGGVSAVRDSGAGPGSATGVPIPSGSRTRARWGANCRARASHAAAMSAGERFPSNQAFGDSLPPATSQLSRLFVLSEIETPRPLFVAYVPAIR